MLVSLTDFAASRRPRGSLLKELYGLSAAEARVAQRLAEGEAPNDIAEPLGLRPSSVRQVVKSILAKTDTHRQSQLTALLCRFPTDTAE
jgi:DNA-binding CsgD family transcriptional regulator